MSTTQKDPRQRLLADSLKTAYKQSLEHRITTDDVPLPKTCSYMNTELDYGKGWKGDNGPTIGRIDPSKGYLPENVQVISNLADRIKGDATIPQLLEFARNVLKKHVEPM